MRSVLMLLILVLAVAGFGPQARAQSRNAYGIAVIIGNKTYQNRDIPEVKFADRDARAMRNFAIDVLGYSDSNIIFLENAGQGTFNKVFGTADDPRGQLARWLRPGGKSDVLVYYSGHGVPGVADGQSYLLPADADPASVSQNGYPLSLLYSNLQKLSAHSVTVLLDACFSGMSAGGTLLLDASPMTRPSAPLRPGEATGLTVLTATRAEQLANWDGKHRHGLFTEYFLEAVYGRADDPQYGGHHDGRIVLGSVQKYLDDEMSYIAQREDGRDQNVMVQGDPDALLATLPAENPPLRHDDPPVAAPPPAVAATPAPAPPAPPPTPAPASVPQAQVAPAAPPQAAPPPAAPAHPPPSAVPDKKLAMITPKPVLPSIPAGPGVEMRGTWTGVYHYPPGVGRSPVQFQLTITVQGQQVSGRIREPNTFGQAGVPYLFANVSGTTTADGGLRFTKTYDGTGQVSHSVEYDGHMNYETGLLTGTWRIGNQGGQFEMRKASD